MLNADLHCHSTFSDGMLTPELVVERAWWRGVRMLALTDHDELGGLPAARERAMRLGMQFVDGVEISANWQEETVHIVGLNIDPEHAPLAAGLARIRATRGERAQRIADGLAAAGVPDPLQGALAQAGNPGLLSRAHFARYLAALGYARDAKAVFEHWLTPGKPGYVPHEWASVAEAVAWIAGSGGTAVIAHPGRYRLDEPALQALIRQFRESGGTAIEVQSGAHSPEQARRFAGIASEHGLLASRASDFHGPRESRMDLGDLPELPPGLVPVWTNWT